jgi:hypothetical protein
MNLVIILVQCMMRPLKNAHQENLGTVMVITLCLPVQQMDQRLTIERSALHFTCMYSSVRLRMANLRKWQCSEDRYSFIECTGFLFLIEDINLCHDGLLTL